jgi:hypothetical protein
MNYILLTDSSNESFLHVALNNKNDYLLKYFLESLNSYEKTLTANVDSLLKYSIINSIERIDIILFEHLITYNAFKTSLDKFLILSIKNNKQILSKLLLIKGASTACTDELTGMTLFETAIEYNLTSIVELLIDHYSIDVNLPCKDGNNLIFKAFNLKNSKISALLLLNGTNIHSKNEDNDDVLMVCIKKKWILHVSYILNKSNIVSYIYNNKSYFRSICFEATKSNSTIIFKAILMNYSAIKIQRKWRKNKKLI